MVLQASACFTPSPMPLAKASHMTQPNVKGGAPGAPHPHPGTHGRVQAVEQDSRILLWCRMGVCVTI